MNIEKALLSDAEALTELTLKSKDYWNYGADQIAEWREELTITPEYILENQVYKLEIDRKPVGFYAYGPANEKKVTLNFLFVAPEHIGKGYGRKMLSDFLERVKKEQFEKVVLDADPHAADFYRKMGFEVTGHLKSSIEARFLPIMELKL